MGLASDCITGNATEMKIPLLLLFSICGDLCAQALAPELAPLAGKHQSEIAALQAQATAALTRVRNAYLEQLNSAEKFASVGRDTKTLAAINAERESINAGQVPTAFPASMPPSLKSPWQTYSAGFIKITADRVQQHRRIDAAYLRDLAVLGAKAPAGSELANQITAEKDATLDKSPTEVPTEANRIVNGNFTDGDRHGFPKGWFVELVPEVSNGPFKIIPKKEGDPLPPGLSVQVATENQETFLRATYSDAKGYLSQAIDIPPGAKTYSLKLHVRGSSPKGKVIKVYVLRKEDAGSRDLAELSPKTWRPLELHNAVGTGTFITILIGNDKLTDGTYEIKRMELVFH